MRRNLFISDARKKRETRRQAFWAEAWGITFIGVLGLAGEQDRRAAEIAYAPAAPVAELKSPVLVKAQGIVESRLNPYAKGDGGKSHGAFQVQPRHWGRVPKGDLFAQARQNERIMDELMCEVDPMYALERYNGSGPKAREYARKVRREALQIALLEVR